MTGYPGNTSRRTVPGGLSHIYDLFLGGGGWTRAAIRANPRAIAVGSESNPIQRAILERINLDDALS